jgi:hypothetical protein
VAFGSDDYVIENPNTDQVSDLAKPPRELNILGARGRISTRVVVNEDNGCGGRRDRGTEHLARVNERRSERADGDELGALHSVLGVEQHSEEVFLLSVGDVPSNYRRDFS